MSTDPQGTFAQPREVTDPADCFFYHFMDLPALGAVGDEGWDLRAGVEAYLGRTNVRDRRVLEIGPASGYLTFHMEEQGADVVGVELGPGTPWDVVPQAGLDLGAILEERRAIMERVRNSFWLARRALGATAQIHYGTAYQLPAELGRFDISVMASVLLHTRDPLRIVEQCARLTDETLIIVDRHFPELGKAPVAHLLPSRENGIWDTWWFFTPELFMAYCEVLGFTRTCVSFHEQRHISGGAEAQIPLFTVVAERD